LDEEFLKGVAEYPGHAIESGAFEKGLATYRKVEAANYIAHREVYGLLHDVLVAEAPEGFVFADLGCGTATGSAKALAGTKIGRYVGVDISGRSLDVAREAL
jgi:ubiquinone/menaquinone biosynthesis C-methylase UbiE